MFVVMGNDQSDLSAAGHPKPQHFAHYLLIRMRVTYGEKGGVRRRLLKSQAWATANNASPQVVNNTILPKMSKDKIAFFLFQF